MRSKRVLGLVAGAGLVWAQDPSALLDPQAIRQSLTQAGTSVQAPDAAPKSSVILKPEPGADSKVEREKGEQKVAAAKAREGAPRRFASDLFETRQTMLNATEGGIAEDYVLGVGDQLQATAVGSANFEIPLQVNGRGDVVIPKVGAVKVAGKTLGGARTLLEASVARNFSNTRLDLSVVKLREVRVFVLGEVYLPGSLLVPSLSSLVNVLGLAGGPTAGGSFRDIRVMRGGRIVHRVDLYPLRAEGLGNMNFSLQNGDTIFVPLAGERVSLEGAFVRVMAKDLDLSVAKIRKEQQQSRDAAGAVKDRDAKDAITKEAIAKEAIAREGDAEDGESRDSVERGAERRVPVMQFEALPGETLKDMVAFAGGLLPQAYATSVALRHQDQDGVTTVRDIPVEQFGGVRVHYGDVVSAFPRRDRLTRSVSVMGWVRVPGTFARPDGLRVGDLLKREAQVMPDTYLGRGEVVRTLEDGSTRFLAFDVAKALAGDPAHDLLLADRDRVELFSLQRMRLPKKVTISGPLTAAGEFDLHDGMRVSDLVFRAGIPQKSANRFFVELARTTSGNQSEVLKLDLGRLLSTESGSPVALRDEALNPRLREDDRVSVYEKPDFRFHRVVRISGQVARPGVYTLDKEDCGMKDLLLRAGGLTTEAMPQGAIFLRRLGEIDPGKRRAADLIGMETSDPTGNGINEILGRLGETKRQPLTGQLLKTPVFHGLVLGTVSRMVVNLPEALKGDRQSDVTLQDGDELIIPRQSDAAYVVGETASPFASFRVKDGMKVRELLSLAGGTTRNADTWHIRLLKADGRILDSWVSGRRVEPGDAVLVPAKVRRDVSWQENLAAITNLAVMYAAIKK